MCGVEVTTNLRPNYRANNEDQPGNLAIQKLVLSSEFVCRQRLFDKIHITEVRFVLASYHT